MLTCQRYIELSPVWANTMAHPPYTALMLDTSGRPAACRDRFRYELEPGLVDEIRQATNGNFELPNDLVAAPVSAGSSRQVCAPAQGADVRIGEAVPK
jgi:putative transposase